MEVKKTDLEEFGETIDEFVENLPPTIKFIAAIAFGAAIGTRFPNLVLFLGLIYTLGQYIDFGGEEDEGPSYTGRREQPTLHV